MKKLTIIYWLAGLLVAGCTSKELSREEAHQLIQERIISQNFRLRHTL